MFKCNQGCKKNDIYTADYIERVICVKRQK